MSKDVHNDILVSGRIAIDLIGIVFDPNYLFGQNVIEEGFQQSGITTEDMLELDGLFVLFQPGLVSLDVSLC